MWDFDPLWAKARLYAARASAENPEKSLYPFWSILALELLARATLAQVHPALLADAQEGSGRNIMYAFGFVQPGAPKSVPANTVFKRCAQVVEGFTEEDVKKATALIGMRNEELHSGGTPFEGLETRAWLVDYYRLCDLLLEHLDKDLAGLFDDEEAAAARRMIDAANEEILGDVRRAIAEKAKGWKSRDEKDRDTSASIAKPSVTPHDKRTWYQPATQEPLDNVRPATWTAG